MSTLAQQVQLPSRNGFPTFSESEMDRRHAFLEDLADMRQLDAIVVCGAHGPLQTEMLFFTNWPPQVESYAVFPRLGPPYLVVRLYNHIPDVGRMSVIDDIRFGGDSPEEQAHTVARSLSALKRSRTQVGLIGAVRHADLETFRRLLPTAAWVDLTDEYRKFRLIKSDDEMSFTRIACAMGDNAVQALEEGLRPGQREFELPRIIEDAYLAERGTNLIHFTLSTPMENPDVCVPHQVQPDRTIAPGDIVVTEISATFWGYTGQVLRSFTVDADPTPLYQDLYAVADETYHAILSRLRAGVRVGEILDAAERIDEAGFAIWDDLVHGFGGAYLPPIIRTRQTRGSTHPEDAQLPRGAVVVVQPNVITRDAQAGVQLGNAVWLQDHGVEVLQSHPMRFARCGEARDR